MRTVLYILFFSLALSASCKRNNDTAVAENPAALLAGNDMKVWKATKETDSEGDKDRLTKGEKEERIVFHKNGNVSLTSSGQTLDGTWSHSGNQLTMHFTGENVTENFTILELEEKKLKLRAVDGSEMTLKPE